MSQDVSLLFDIGSGSVGAALVARGAKPDMLWLERLPIPPEPNLDLGRLQEKIYQHLKTLAEHARKASAGKNIDKVFCMYGAPWHVSKHLTLSIKRDKPFTVSEKFINSVIDKEKEGLLAGLRSQKLFEGEAYIANKTVTNITLNGYPVSDPYQSGIGEFGCSVFFDLVEKTVVAKVESIIHKTLRIRPVFHNASPLALWKTIQRLVSGQENFMIVAVGEELTELILSKKSSVESTVSFPAGTHTLLRAMRIDGQEYHIALSLVKLHLDRKGEPEWTSSVEKYIEEARQNWIDLFGKALEQIRSTSSLPRRIFFIHDEIVRTFFGDYTKDVQKAYGSENLDLVFFDNAARADLIDMAEGIGRDALLETESISSVV